MAAGDISELVGVVGINGWAYGRGKSRKPIPGGIILGLGMVSRGKKG